MLGVFIVLGASPAWGFGSVLSHRLPIPADAMLAAAIEMLAGGVVLLAVAAATGEFSRVHWSAVPATSWIALAYLIGPGSILAFTAYGYALSHLPPPPSPPTPTSTRSSPCWPGSCSWASSSAGARGWGRRWCSPRSSSS